MNKPLSILHSPSSNSDLPELTENAGVIARADTGQSEGSPAPAILEVNAEVQVQVQVLEASAAQSAEIAAQFARTGDRRNARLHLQRALEQLNEAEIEG